MTVPPHKPGPRFVPEEGPSRDALEAFGRALADGLRERFPGLDFIVRRRETPAAPSTPDDGDAVRRD